MSGYQSPRKSPALPAVSRSVKPKSTRADAEQAMPLFTAPPLLTNNQQHVYHMTERGQPFADGIRGDDAGRELHVWGKRPCGCDVFLSCEWAHAQGRQILEALKRKGLLRMDRHHVYRRVEQTASPQGDFPEGF